MQKTIKLVKNLNAVFRAPPSKAHTLRALFIASLAEGKSVLKNALNAEDQKIAMNALNNFGAKIEFNGKDFIVEGTNGNLIAPNEEIFTENSGVTTRFLISIAGLSKGNSIINGNKRMRERPIKDLIDALKKVGVQIEKDDGFLPVKIIGESFKGGTSEIEGNTSSQYLSGMLIAAPYTKNGLHIKVNGNLKSKPYIDITISCMREFGVGVVNRQYKEFFVRGNSKYKGREYEIEGDYTSASYFFAAAAITQGKVKVTNLNPFSDQGDKFFLECLKKMGCEVKIEKDSIEVIGKPLNSISIDMQNYPDIVPTLGIVMAFANGKSIVTNISHLVLKESNRIETTARELMACGIEAIAKEDSLEIIGGTPKGALIETHNDHRIAMAFSIMGLAVPGIEIDDFEVVNKSYPNFYQELKNAYQGGSENRNIGLIGFRGTGKTTLGKKLAKRLNMQFIDTDKEIVKETGRKIPQIFQEKGEKGFREIESKIVKRVSSMENVCIAYGGGVILSKENIENLKRNSTIILLESDINTIHARIKRDKNRPILTNKKAIEEIEHLLEERRENYEKTASLRFNTGNINIYASVQKIIDTLNEKGLL